MKIILEFIPLCFFAGLFGYFLGYIEGRKAAYLNASKWIKELTDQVRKLNNK